MFQHFLRGEPVLGIEYEAQLQKTLIPGYSPTLSVVKCISCLRFVQIILYPVVLTDDHCTDAYLYDLCHWIFFSWQSLFFVQKFRQQKSLELQSITTQSVTVL